jgi:hypothetical protein
MSIDYSSVDHVMRLAFAKLDGSGGGPDFPAPGSLSAYINGRLTVGPDCTIAHSHVGMVASASVEMWHRAIHSFLWSVALTKSTPLWASISGYYASHFVMRAFAYSMGVFKSFVKRTAVQVTVDHGHFMCSPFSAADGEHAFYWKIVRRHPDLIANSLFKDNSERDPKSDSSHRTFANYTDHVGKFVPLGIPSSVAIASDVERISRIRLHSVESPARDDYPDIHNVQILAFQRIVAFQDFLDGKVPDNKFWRRHRRPIWCRDLMRYQVDELQLDAPVS